MAQTPKSITVEVKAIPAYIQRLQRFGSSIELSWGEDDDLWSLAWISGGKRYSATAISIADACAAVLNQAAADKFTR